MSAPDRSARAASWVAHLRAGGTVAWADWQGTETASAGFLSGAQQLELLRRLNAVGGVTPSLAQRVLAASAPGRGRPDLQLLGGGPDVPHGPRPVDPATLPADELVRVATSLLADDVVSAGAARPPRHAGAVLAGLRPGLSRRRYRLVGDSVVADQLRAELIGRGHRPGGRGAHIVVLGAATDLMLADAFEARALDTGGPAWGDWLDILAARDELAPRADLARMAARWAQRAPGHPLTIVLDPGALAPLLRVPPLAGVRRLSAEAVELSRRLAAVLGMLVPPEQRSLLLRETWAPRLRAREGSVLAVPAAHQEWVHEKATRMRAALLRAGYPVAGGDLDAVLPAAGAPSTQSSVERVDDEGVLRLAIEVLIDTAQESGQQAAQETGEEVHR